MLHTTNIGEQDMSLHHRRLGVLEELFQKKHLELDNFFNKKSEEKREATEEQLDQQFKENLRKLSEQNRELFNLIEEYINLLNEKSHQSWFDYLGHRNHQVHLGALAIALTLSVGDLTAEWGHPLEFLSSAPNLAYAGLPAVIFTLALGGFIDVLKAATDSEMENRLLTGVEGLNRAATGSVVLALQLNWMQTSAFTIQGIGTAIPFLFALIVAGMIAKESYLLHQTQKKIKTLEAEISQNEDKLREQITLLRTQGEKEEDIRKDLIVQRLSLKLTESTIQLVTLKEQEKSQKTTIGLLSTVGLVSVALFALASVFPPAGAALIVIAMLLFVSMSFYIKHIKAQEKMNCDAIKNKPVGAIQGRILGDAINLSKVKTDEDKESAQDSKQAAISTLISSPKLSVEMGKSEKVTKSWATMFSNNRDEIKKIAAEKPKDQFRPKFRALVA